jgi:multidrug efflux pump subunit AcrB
VDRSKAQDIGLTQRDVASSLLASTSGSYQTAPTFWLDPRNGVSYNINAQSPQYDLQSLIDLENIPLTTTSAADSVIPNPSLSVGSSSLTPIGTGAAPSTASGVRPIQILGNVATLVRGNEPATISHYNIAPVLDIYGNVVNSDLRSVSDKIALIIEQHRKELPRGSQIVMRGQVQTMNSSFIGLVSGLAFSILLVYLLIVVNFQSWLDPFMIIAALPAALSGIVWMLFITHTHISVPALTGSIMTMGVATANSILVISFAREQMEENAGDAHSAALNAGYTRFRPVLMTALAMIIGMVPMALGLGDGGEQNAPLGRSVIGGLLFATLATLFFVPTLFSVIHGWLGKRNKATSDGASVTDLED